MPGDAGLMDAGLFDQIVDGLLTFSQRVNDTSSGRVGERLEDV